MPSKIPRILWPQTLRIGPTLNLSFNYLTIANPNPTRIGKEAIPILADNETSRATIPPGILIIWLKNFKIQIWNLLSKIYLVRLPMIQYCKHFWVYFSHQKIIIQWESDGLAQILWRLKNRMKHSAFKCNSFIFHQLMCFWIILLPIYVKHWYFSQCGNVRIFLQVRYYVKSIWAKLKYQNNEATNWRKLFSRKFFN